MAQLDIFEDTWQSGELWGRRSRDVGGRLLLSSVVTQLENRSREEMVVGSLVLFFPSGEVD